MRCLGRFLVILLTLSVIVYTDNVSAQTYKDSIAAHRRLYIQELLADKRQPLKPKDTSKLSFYKPDKAYKVKASIVLTPNSIPFQIPTHSGKFKNYKSYGIATFMLKKQKFSLHLYQSLEKTKDSIYASYLFLPFKDQTNYSSTYGGGRYLDFQISDIIDNSLVIDFNKAYNPYCAYSEGFNCPIPPDENVLKVSIRSGEKNFTH